MHDNAVVSTIGPKPTVYITTQAGSVHHFTDAGQLATWVKGKPPFAEVLAQFLAALDERGLRQRPATGGSVDDALTLVAAINAKRKP